MIKQAPSVGRIAAMVIFALSCFGILLFLWLSFGGAIPLRPEGYRFHARIPEAATLAQEADVRLAGVNVGKLKTKELDKRGARTVIEIELEDAYAPIPKDSRVMLRQKTLLGESYIEIAKGDKRSGMLEDGGTLPNVQVEPTVELDEIFSAFDDETRSAFQEWIRELAKAIRNGRGADLNSAFGNLEGFAVDGAKLFKVLDEQEIAVRRLIRNTGEVFGAINEREGALGELIVNANNVFEATASRDEALAQTFEVFPTFLDESRITLARLERFARNTHPLVIDLKGPADDLGPTVRDLGDLAPDLEALFRDLPPLIRAGRRGLPDLARVLTGAEPVFEAIRPFLTQLNPIISYANFHQKTISSFLTIGGTNFGCTMRGPAGNCNPDAGSKRYQINFGLLPDAPIGVGTPPANSVPRVFARWNSVRPPYDRGQAYLQPNALLRAAAVGVIEAFDCPGPIITNPIDTGPNGTTQPPCFESPASLYPGGRFVVPQAGRAPLVQPPRENQGTAPANDPNPGDPAF